MMTFGEQIGLNALNAGLGIIGGGITSAIQHKYNRELSEYQNAVNVSNWNMQNEYNSPINQRKRLEEAGLNPALMYGNGSTSTANAGNIPSYQSFGQDITSNMLGMMQMAQMASNVRLTNAQAEGIEQENPYRGQTAKAVLDNYMKDVEVKDTQVKQMFKNIEKVDIDINKVNTEIELLNKEITLRMAQTNSENEKAKLIRSQESLILFQKVLTLEQALNTREERGLVKYKKENLEAQTASLQVKTAIDRWEKEYIDANGYKPDAGLVQFITQFLSSVITENNGGKGLIKTIAGIDVGNLLGIKSVPNDEYVYPKPKESKVKWEK